MKKNTAIYIRIIFLLLLSIPAALKAQEVSRSFELRYFTSDSSANGITDFKGETEYFNTKQRIRFLKQYADYASRFFKDTNYNTEVVTNQAAKQRIKSIKPQPLPHVRTRIPLKTWRWMGYKKGQYDAELQKLQRWEGKEGVIIDNGHLKITDNVKSLKWTFPSQSWRFAVQWKVKAPQSGADTKFIFSDKQLIKGATVGLSADGSIFYYSTNNKRKEAGKWDPNHWHTFKVEFDLAAKKRGKDMARYNLYVDGKLIADYVPLQRVDSFYIGKETHARIFSSIGQINTLEIQASSGTQLDDLWGVGYHLTGRESYPYTVETFLDEHFERKPRIEGWEQLHYEDSGWQQGDLPIVHGSERHSGEALYLRKELVLKDFKRVVLNIETIDPGGEIWVNGRKVKEITRRYPVKLDVTRFLKKHQRNVLAIKVDPFYLTKEVGEIMPHTYLDYNVGWFAGRAWLDLTGTTTMEDLFVFTTEIEKEKARLQARFTIDPHGIDTFTGKVVLHIYPWFPTEGKDPVSSDTVEIEKIRGKKDFITSFEVPHAELWAPETPHLYKVEASLLDEKGRPTDDNVKTIGIRTLSQKGGTFRLNGKPAMLNGSLMFGFRSPLSKMMVWNRCPPLYEYAKDLMTVKKMNGNAMRVHIHDWMFPAVNINDPRLPELADQMGMMLIWATPAWIRVGKSWRAVDLEGYPRYMKQVRNHPSIVMWELANHIQSFNTLGVEEANQYVKKAYQTVYPVDPSRLISYMSYVHHFTYYNDEGTIDRNGDSITPAPEWTAPQVTRGNQITIFGYGKNWDVLRKWPDKYHQSMLDSKERAYFNFEHEESTGQPNWNLVKGKPWYHLHSYEWDYDIGSIGRHLRFDEWKESQAWQAFSAWESMKKQWKLGIDGFLWMGLRGGANSVTYRKPLMDFQGHAKLVYWINKMIFQKTVAGSDNEDVVYGPEDKITPLVMHLGPEESVDLKIIIKDMNGNEVAHKTYKNINMASGRTKMELSPWKPRDLKDGIYKIDYTVIE